MTSHAPKDRPAADAPVLHEGTPAALIAVDGFRAAKASSGQTVTFVLAEDISVRGKVLAKAGDVASGEVAQVSEAKASGEPMSVALDRVTLHAGSVTVPLRGNQVRGSVDPMQYKELPESGKVEVTLFVAQNVSFPESQ
ncbi:MAG TPA: hypothetical protein VMJ75_21400 [Candidatus Acidoferrales bacterium]|nr:hypothetical protein [Candidatus Acidoferrales bacterium]